MKKYIGTKCVEAEPMCMREACERNLLKNGVIPVEEDSGILGYHVRYEDGYESWSPKDVFEKAYKVAETPADRMRIESNDLVVKYAKLAAFIDAEIIPKMQSLPQSAKDLILKGKGFINYTNQCLIYNEDTGKADSWTPSVDDMFAEDWEIVI